MRLGTTENRRPERSEAKSRDLACGSQGLSARAFGPRSRRRGLWRCAAVAAAINATVTRCIDRRRVEAHVMVGRGARGRRRLADPRAVFTRRSLSTARSQQPDDEARDQYHRDQHYQSKGRAAHDGVCYSAAFATGSKRVSKSRMDFSTVSAICLSLSWWTTFRPNRSLT
jgi:hypothetical protein